jgi:S-adenosyl-L-methionine hydrolase (adenosine-forming)
MNKLITITTDFGDSFAVSQLKAVIYSLGFDGNLIENHDVSNFSILEAAFQLKTLIQFCPKGTINVCVVDPGVGSSRSGIIIQTNNYWFVGPDNGCLYPAARKNGIVSVWKINESKLDNHISRTFHGRDIFVRVAVNLSQDKYLKKPEFTQIDIRSLKRIHFKEGQVLHVDHYGNVKINYTKPIEIGKKLIFQANNNRFEIPVFSTFSDVEIGMPLVYLGSSNTLELAINQSSAAQKYSIRVGDILSITTSASITSDVLQG